MEATATTLFSGDHDGTAAELPKASNLEAKTNAPATALTPPTSEDLDKDHSQMDDGSSDLSDLDMDMDMDIDMNMNTGANVNTNADTNADAEEEVEPIVPDHYWGDGKIPVFKPVCCCSWQHYCRPSVIASPSC